MAIPEIAAGLTAIAHLKNLMAAAKGVSDTIKINDVVVEAQEYLLKAQESLFEAREIINKIAEEKTELKRQISELEDWKKEEGLYKIIEPKSGIFVYALRDETQTRMYCPNCFINRKASILQRAQNNSSNLKCFACNFLVNIGPDFTPVAIC